MHVDRVRKHVRDQDHDFDYAYVRQHRGIGIVAIDQEGQLVMVRQWRYPLQREMLEIPAGGQDEGESPLECAKRELAEETGLGAREWVQLGKVQRAVSTSNEENIFFLARELYPEDGHAMDPHESLEIEWIPFAEAVDRVHSGELDDIFTGFALLRAQAYLQSEG